jgi:hypothetical protein
MKMAAFSDVAPFRLIKVYLRFTDALMMKTVKLL